MKGRGTDLLVSSDFGRARNTKKQGLERGTAGFPLNQLTSVPTIGTYKASTVVWRKEKKKKLEIVRIGHFLNETHLDIFFYIY